MDSATPLFTSGKTESPGNDSYVYWPAQTMLRIAGNRPDHRATIRPPESKTRNYRIEESVLSA